MTDKPETIPPEPEIFWMVDDPTIAKAIPILTEAMVSPATPFAQRLDIALRFTVGVKFAPKPFSHVIKGATND